MRADSRERSAASSSSGCARSESVRGGSATPPMLAADGSGLAPPERPPANCASQQLSA